MSDAPAEVNAESASSEVDRPQRTTFTLREMIQVTLAVGVGMSLARLPLPVVILVLAVTANVFCSLVIRAAAAQRGRRVYLVEVFLPAVALVPYLIVSDLYLLIFLRIVAFLLGAAAVLVAPLIALRYGRLAAGEALTMTGLLYLGPLMDSSDLPAFLTIYIVALPAVVISLILKLKRQAEDAPTPPTPAGP